MAKRISILGSTGSIGVQTLEIVSAFPGRFNVVGLSVGRRVEELKQQMLRFRPEIVSVRLESDAQDMRLFVRSENLKIQVEWGEDGLEAVAASSDLDLLVVAVVGTAALMPTYLAIKKGITIGLACKEVLVAAGRIIMDLAEKHGVSILPIDSEHAAIKQCLAGIGEDRSQIEKLILTASGGPFWQKPKEEFSEISRESALMHPNWEMGAKITIDSATLLNKGLEVIEAHHLFGVAFEKIEVVIHPQSIVHSMVEFSDGTLLSQMGLPDMRFPIQYVLTYPEKCANDWPKTKVADLPDLQFRPPDTEKFPLLSLAFEVGKRGGSAPAVLNAANEAAVQLFLDEKIGFMDIPRLVRKYVDEVPHVDVPDIETIVSIDQQVKKDILNGSF